MAQGGGKPDTRYLHRRHRTWWVKLRIPLDVRRLHPGEPSFVWRNLRTRDLKEAQRLRHAAVAAEQARWERLRRDRPAGPDDIRRLAEAEMHRCYAELAGRLLEVADELPRLEMDAALARLIDGLDAEGEALLRREGFTVTAETARALGDKLADARRFAAKALREGIKLPDAPAPQPERARGVPLAEAIDGYLAELRRPGGDKKPKSVDQVEKSLRLVESYVAAGSTVAEVTRRTAGEFVGDLQRLDPDYRRDPEARGLGLRRAGGAAPGRGRRRPRLGHGPAARVERPRPVEVGRGRAAWPQGNPWSGLRLPKAEDAEGHLPYTPAELRRLAAALPEAPPEVALAFLVALHSGMRRGEVASIDAVVLDAPVPYFELRGSRRKSKAGRRRVPIHPLLLPLLEDVDAARLLRVKPDTLGKRFASWKGKAGVDRDGTDFHSLRKNFTKALEQAGVPENQAALLLGHATGRGFRFTTYNPDGLEMEQLWEAVGKVRHAGLDLRHTPAPQLSQRPRNPEQNQRPAGLAPPTGFQPVSPP